MSIPEELLDAGTARRLLDRGEAIAVDSTWYPAGRGRDGRGEFLHEALPAARFLDIDVAAAPESGPLRLPPAPADFARLAGGLGIGSGHAVVVYDRAGLYSAARGWWLLRLFGHRQVSVLDGGLPHWRRAGGPTEPGVPSHPEAAFEASFADGLQADRAAVRSAMESGDAVILDARDPDSFAGRTAPSLPWVRPGHIPSSRNLPWAELLDEARERMKPAEALLASFAGRGVGPSTPVICTCGGGITACMLALALERTGHRRWRVYAGAWNDWGGDPAMPVATGAAG